MIYEWKFNLENATPETDLMQPAREKKYHSVGVVETTETHCSIAVVQCYRVELLHSQMKSMSTGLQQAD